MPMVKVTGNENVKFFFCSLAYLLQNGSIYVEPKPE